MLTREVAWKDVDYAECSSIGVPSRDPSDGKEARTRGELVEDCC